MESFRPAIFKTKRLCIIRLLTLPVIFSLFMPALLIEDYSKRYIKSGQILVMEQTKASGKQEGAVKFLNSLKKSQREKTQFKFDDTSKTRWHYLPGATWPRAGIQLYELDETQKHLLFSLLQNFLSEAGYDKTKQIISLEEVLAELGGSTSVRDPGKYFTAFYGDPGKDKLWAWSFQGHHLSLNFTVSDDNISIAPRFFGANPATVPSGKRKGERTLAKEEDYGFELINSMTDMQLKEVVFSSKTFSDITTANAPEVIAPEPAGIRMKDLDISQKNILLSLLDEYLSAMPRELALMRMENLKKEEFDEIRFGWAGGTIPGEAHYYRIQGKTFLVEFDNSQNNANHIHTVWRDFNGDFGRDLIREHYRTSDHHHPHRNPR